MSIVLDVQTISVLVASASIVAGAIYYMLETRHQRIERQTESILRLSPWFSLNAKEIQEAINKVCSAEYTNYKEYLEKYGGKPEQTSLKLLGNYFEGVGLLVYRKLVETDIKAPLNLNAFAVIIKTFSCPIREMLMLTSIHSDQILSIKMC